MDRKRIIIIAIILLIIAGAILMMLATWVNYERIEITPNGTSLDAPANQTKYQGEFEGAKIWNWNNGILVTYNGHEDPLKLTGLGFEAATKLIKTGEMQNISGYTVYVINADELLEIHIFDIIKVNYNGKFYCIPLTNETTQDNLIICCNNKDIALHMAESVKYKNVYPNSTYLDKAESAINEIAEGLQSTADAHANNTTLTDVKSTIDEKTSDLQSTANGYINNANLNDAKSTIEKIAGDILFKSPI